jgi:hypothetical protein
MYLARYPDFRGLLAAARSGKLGFPSFSAD